MAVHKLITSHANIGKHIDWKGGASVSVIL